MATRDVILDAAAEVIRSLGLGRATTKEIARASGYSEATLYKHFQGKEELFVAVLRERVPSFGPLREALARRPGDGSVRDNLADVVRAAAMFYVDSFPMSASIYSEPALLAAHRTGVARQGNGPQVALEVLAEYLRGEQRVGRVLADADAAAVAAMVLGAALNYGFLTSFAGRSAEAAEVERLAAAVADTAVRAIR